MAKKTTGKAQKRITPEQVKAAYKSCGMEPIRHDFYEPAISCCPALGCGIAAVVIDSCDAPDGEEWDAFTIDVAASQIYGDGYTAGFVCGFDNYELESFDGQSPGFGIGYADGKAAAKSVFDDVA